MYTIEKKKLGKFEKVVLMNTETNEFVSFIPTFGTLVQEIVLQKNGGQLFSLLDSPKDADEIEKNEWYQGAHLAPFPNRINCGQYKFNTQTYSLPINFPNEGHAIHGFLYNKKFTVTDFSSTKDGAEASAEYHYDGELGGYPFPFLIHLTYTLSKEGFSCSVRAKNIGGGTMPFGYGWHPYFTFHKAADKIELLLPRVRRVVTENMIPNGDTAPYEKFSSFEEIRDEIFDTTFEIISSKKTETILRDKEDGLSIKIWQESEPGKLNFLQVFIPPSRTSVAIEPTTSAPNAFNNGIGLITLAPGEQFASSFGVSIE